MTGVLPVWSAHADPMCARVDRVDLTVLERSRAVARAASAVCADLAARVGGSANGWTGAAAEAATGQAAAEAADLRIAGQAFGEIDAALGLLAVELGHARARVRVAAARGEQVWQQARHSQVGHGPVSGEPTVDDVIRHAQLQAWAVELAHCRLTLERAVEEFVQRTRRGAADLAGVAERLPAGDPRRIGGAAGGGDGMRDMVLDGLRSAVSAVGAAVGDSVVGDSVVVGTLGHLAGSTMDSTLDVVRDHAEVFAAVEDVLTQASIVVGVAALLFFWCPPAAAGVAGAGLALGAAGTATTALLAASQARREDGTRYADYGDVAEGAAWTVAGLVPGAKAGATAAASARSVAPLRTVPAGMAGEAAASLRAAGQAVAAPVRTIEDVRAAMLHAAQDLPANPREAGFMVGTWSLDAASLTDTLVDERRHDAAVR